MGVEYASHVSFSGQIVGCRAGNWLMGHQWVERVTFYDGPYGSWVDIRWPVTHFFRQYRWCWRDIKINTVNMVHCAQTAAFNVVRLIYARITVTCLYFCYACIIPWQLWFDLFIKHLLRFVLLSTLDTGRGQCTNILMGRCFDGSLGNGSRLMTQCMLWSVEWTFSFIDMAALV